VCVSGKISKSVNYMNLLLHSMRYNLHEGESNENLKYFLRVIY
jgi:hypothetical protein